MNKLNLRVLPVIILLLIVPSLAFAAANNQRTLTGVVTKAGGNQIVFRTTSAASYLAETGSAQLARKNGASMNFLEILPGDRVEVRGTLWADNSISANYVRNMSLYAHTGTFSGKISSINPLDSSFTLQSKTYGSQTIRTDGFTTFKKNSKSVTFKDLELGISATVKGVWDRTNTLVAAKSVEATVRLININVTGTLVMKNGTGLTILGSNNVVYGVDASKAKFQDKNSKAISSTRLNLGDILKIQGKHISESVQVSAITVKDTSVTK